MLQELITAIEKLRITMAAARPDPEIASVTSDQPPAPRFLPFSRKHIFTDMDIARTSKVERVRDIR